MFGINKAIINAFKTVGDAVGVLQEDMREVKAKVQAIEGTNARGTNARTIKDPARNTYNDPLARDFEIEKLKAEKRHVQNELALEIDNRVNLAAQLANQDHELMTLRGKNKDPQQEVNSQGSTLRSLRAADAAVFKSYVYGLPCSAEVAKVVGDNKRLMDANADAMRNTIEDLQAQLRSATQPHPAAELREARSEIARLETQVAVLRVELRDSQAREEVMAAKLTYKNPMCADLESQRRLLAHVAPKLDFKNGQ